MITEECINCGNCARECPNTAIYEGGAPWSLDGETHPAPRADIFYIATPKCTDCVGFFGERQCAQVCPVDCCVPDPNAPEDEAVLLAKARRLHPDHVFPPEPPSLYRRGRGPRVVDGRASDEQLVREKVR
jgi:ferredoxin